MSRRPFDHDVSPVDGIILGGLLGSLVLAATIQLSADGARPHLRIFVAAALAGTGLGVFATRIVRGAGGTVGMRLLGPPAVATLVVWIVIAVRLVHGGGTP